MAWSRKSRAANITRNLLLKPEPVSGVITYNMKRTLLILTLGALVACPVTLMAEDANTPPPPPPEGGPGGHHHDKMAGLSEAERAELKKAHDAAIAADPTLATEEQSLKAGMTPGQPPSDEQREKMHAFREKMDAAMIKADPAVAPIIEKLKKNHKEHGPGGPPPAAPAAGA